MSLRRFIAALLSDDTTGALGFTNPLTGSDVTLVQKLASSGIPFIRAPSGTMANNGAVTLGTALSTGFTQAFLLLPANAIFAGSAQGWYYAVFSSTTAAQVYQNQYTGGVPQVPANPAAWAVTGPGAYTGITGAVNGPQINIPANTLGKNGSLTIKHLWGIFSSANNKVPTINIASSLIFGPTVSAIGNLSALTTLWNVNNASQIAHPAGDVGGVGTAAGVPFQPSPAIDFTVNNVLSFVFNDVTATDWSVLQGFTIEVAPG